MTAPIAIVGAGPAGLTAAYELQSAGVDEVTVLEAGDQVGGISRTINHNGNRIDIGGHRFFSKSDWVMNWWLSMLPLAEGIDVSHLNLRYRGQTRESLSMSREAPPDVGAAMLLRNRLSRIYFGREFFDYPLKLNLANLRKLGVSKTVSFGLSYVHARLKPIEPENTLEDFLVNRFGRRLYGQFFKEYTEKVWGVPCSHISAEWGAQRIKSLSITKAISHALKSAFGLGADKAAQTSLIESFIYPMRGPGQMWETVAARFAARGGKLHLNTTVDSVSIEQGRVRGLHFRGSDGSRGAIPCTHLISTMPVRDLIQASRSAWSADVVDTAIGLQYRDFITIGLLYRAADLPRPLMDNWIYIQEPGVLVGRVQVFNNWSPFMVADPDTVWLGLEYFCGESDPIWSMSDEALKELAQREAMDIGLVSSSMALDSIAIRVPKAYPGYFGDAYGNFGVIRKAVDSVDNLFLIGRNGMHRYNNQDHSMLTAREAVSQIVSGRVDKGRIWDINVGDEYHEEGDGGRS